LSGGDDRYMMEKRYLLPDGSPVWVNLTVALIRDDAGAPEFFVSVIEDLSEVKRAHAAATQDPLTGLLNRRGLMETLPGDLARCGAAARPLALLYIDLNEFKQVNDRYGHARGDACLADAGARLAATVGSRGSVARVGGDEFVVTMPGGTADEAAALLARIKDALHAIEIAPGWPLAASYGCAVAEAGEAIADQLIEAADHAMFNDKRRRRPGTATS
jgi:diguanylate cyclase (GGDEF)-like protein